MNQKFRDNKKDNTNSEIKSVNGSKVIEELREEIAKGWNSPVSSKSVSDLVQEKKEKKSEKN